MNYLILGLISQNIFLSQLSISTFIACLAQIQRWEEVRREVNRVPALREGGTSSGRQGQTSSHSGTCCDEAPGPVLWGLLGEDLKNGEELAR